jgi:hypothetical protein
MTKLDAERRDQYLAWILDHTICIAYGLGLTKLFASTMRLSNTLPHLGQHGQHVNTYLKYVLCIFTN